MRKKLIIFSLLIICLSLCSCIKPIEIEVPLGEKIKNDFTVNEYFSDNAILQENATINITGTSEKGVVMVATIYDSKDNLVVMNYGITEDDNSFTIMINTPKASTKEYRLEIKDSNDIYKHTYEKIKFGQVWLINKNDFYVEEEKSVNQNSIELTNCNYYYMTETESKWITEETNEKINPFISELAKVIYNENKSLFTDDVPVGIIILDVEEHNIYEWISKNNIDRIKLIKDYFEKFKIDNDNKVSKLYECFLKPLENIKLNGIIWNFSLKEANNAVIYNEKYFNIYGILLNVLTNYFCDSYGENTSIVFIQSENSNNEIDEKLRKEQIKNSYYFNNTILIPTYDLNVTYNEELEEYELTNIDTETLLKRITSVLYDDSKISGYSKLIMHKNEKNEITDIIITISNTDKLVVTPNGDLNELTVLEIYDEAGELIDIDYQISGNRIIINLLKEKNSEISPEEPDEETTEQKVLEEEILEYYKISKIVYNTKYENNSGWLYNEYMIPVLPFVIEVGK